MTALSLKNHLQLLFGDLAILVVALCIASPAPLIFALKGIVPLSALFFMLLILTPITVFISGYMVSRRYLMRFGHIQLIPQQQKERMKSGVKNITNAGINKTQSGIKAASTGIAKFLFRHIVELIKFTLKFILRFSLHFSVWAIPAILIITISLMSYSPGLEFSGFEFSRFGFSGFANSDFQTEIIKADKAGREFGLIYMYLLANYMWLFTLITAVIYALLSMILASFFKGVKSRKISHGKTRQEISVFRNIYFGTVWSLMLLAMPFVIVFQLFTRLILAPFFGLGS